VSFFFQGDAGTAPRLTISGAASTLQGVAGATLAAWVAYTGPGSPDEEVIVNVSTGTNIAQARANLSCRHAIDRWRVSGRRLDADAVVTVDSTSPITAAPTHVCGVLEYTGQIARIYINGVEEATTAVAGWTGLSSATPALGAAIGGRADASAAASIQGLVGHVSVYSRALSAAEVMGLFVTQGRDNQYFGLGNRFRLQGIALAAAVPAGGEADSVGTLAAIPAGGPPLLEGSNYMAVQRRRRRR
jgi:Concanavalin A-like lectin/glucanases superfamily